MPASCASGGPGLDRRRPDCPTATLRAGDRLDDDRPGADHAIGADVGHDDGTVPDPRIAADADPIKPAALVLDRLVERSNVVLSAAAEDVDVAADRRVLLQHRLADGAAEADVDAAREFRRPDGRAGCRSRC